MPNLPFHLMGRFLCHFHLDLENVALSGLNGTHAACSKSTIAMAADTAVSHDKYPGPRFIACHETKTSPNAKPAMHATTAQPAGLRHAYELMTSKNGLNFSPVAKSHGAPSAAMCATANSTGMSTGTVLQANENRQSSHLRNAAIC